MLGHAFPCPWQYKASSWWWTQHDMPAVIWSCRHRLRIVHSSWQWLFFDSLTLPPDDQSSETVWRGDDRSSDRHLFPLIDHRKNKPVWREDDRSSPRQTVSDDRSSPRETNSDERSSPRQTVADDRSSEREINSFERSSPRQNDVDGRALPDWKRIKSSCFPCCLGIFK